MVYDSESAISKFLEMTLVVVIGTVEKITAVINPQSLVTKEELQQVKEEFTQIIWGSADTEIKDNEVLFVLEDGTGGTDPSEGEGSGGGGSVCDCSPLTEEEIDEATP